MEYEPLVGICLNCTVQLSNIWYQFCPNCQDNPIFRLQDDEYCKLKVAEYKLKNGIDDEPDVPNIQIEKPEADNVQTKYIKYSDAEVLALYDKWSKQEKRWKPWCIENNIKYSSTNIRLIKMGKITSRVRH